MELRVWICWHFYARLRRKTLVRLQHTPKESPQYSPHAHVPIVYATKNTQQYATAPDTSRLLNPKEIQYIWSVTGSFLYYGRALDNTTLPALNEIVSEQAQSTQQAMEKAQCLMDYVITYPNNYIRYYASDRILNIDSDAAYFFSPKANSEVQPIIICHLFHITQIQWCYLGRMQNTQSCCLVGSWSRNWRYLPQCTSSYTYQNTSSDIKTSTTSYPTYDR